GPRWPLHPRVVRTAVRSLSRARLGYTGSPASLSPQRGEDSHVVARLDRPRKLILDARSPATSHSLTPLRVIEQPCNLASSLHRIIPADVDSGITRAAAGLSQVGRHNGDLVGHVFQGLVHGGAVVELVLWIGCHAQVRGGQPPAELVMVHAAGEQYPRVQSPA